MKKTTVFYALLAAVCYGISVPVSKLLLENISPALMASLLYIGAGSGMLLVSLTGKNKKHRKEARITRKDLPYTIAMVGLDIAAPLFLMFGLSMTTSATASLLNNFEIVATTIVALVFFKEAVGKRMWLSIALITISGILLSVEDFNSLSFSTGSLFVLLACVCWGIENNCTRMLSLKNPVEIVIIKGFGAGFGAFIIALIIGEFMADLFSVIFALLLGFVAFGLSIYFYILAQRGLGASRTSAYYAFAPFAGVILSFVLFRDGITLSFGISFAIMGLGAYLAVFERHIHKHVHPCITHEHRHNHQDMHHNHFHSPIVEGEHSHFHTHEPFEHEHVHTPDLHHTHIHGTKNAPIQICT
jgi:drug/metabolite transporter (DMT)-like permease